MTDKEIIEAFIGCCISHRLECEDCIYCNRLDCLPDLYADIIALVDRQQDEVERLNNLCEYWEAEAKEARAELPNNSRESVEIFVDRLSNYKEYRYNENCDFVPYVKLSDIEKVIYEMVGDEE